MNINLRKITYSMVITAMITLGTVMQAQAQQRAYYVTDRQVQDLFSQIESKTDNFEREVERSLDRSVFQGTRREDTINQMVSDFESSTDRLKSNFSSRRSSANDVQDVLNRAVRINTFMRNNHVSPSAQNLWGQIRNDLNTLAGYYRVTSRWDDAVHSPGTQTGFTVTDAQMRTLLNRLQSRTNSFVQSYNNWNRSAGNRRVASAGNVQQSVIDYTRALTDLRNNYRNSNAGELLRPAAEINRFVTSNRLNNTVTNRWTLVRNDLDTLAQYYRMSSTWNDTVISPGNQTGYAVTDGQMRTLLNRIQSRTNSFIQSYNSWNRSAQNRRMSSASNVQQDISDYTRALNDFRNNYNNRASDSAVEILRPAAEINRFIKMNRLNNTVTSRWSLLRSDLDTLASYSRTAWDWNRPYNPMPGTTYPTVNYGNFDSQLTGSYRLNTSQSENVRTVVDRAISDARYPSNQADRLRGNLERRLASPETLSFEKRGQQITMATANAQSVSLTADGERRSEMSPNGRSVTTTVTERNGQLAIDYEGDRMNDFHLTFTPVGNSQLRVTRRIYLENNNQSITVASVYDKTGQNPQWSTGYPPIYTSGGTTGYPTGGFIIPNNTALIATLNSPLSTRNVQDGDRFTMTVNSPSQFNGAVIEGNVIAKQSGVVSGRATMSLNFTSIRMRDGSTHQFAGIIDQVREVNGNVINVDNEGAVRERSQTTQTVARAGIGAVLGAIIGAIAGGGSGAAIGAGVGAGAGAGTVILQGRDNLDLERGTQFAITASAPSNVGIR